MSCELDHLVVAARTLDEGVAWCEAMLGVIPTGGGKHALMGTHNRVMSIASPQWPRAYLEFIAVDPQAPHPGRARWFDLDSPAMHERLARGPRLVHWVARCDDIELRSTRWRGVDADPGDVLAAERQTERGWLRWRISMRPDGVRLFDGAWPTLIQWDGPHPTDTMAPGGVVLQQVNVRGLPSHAWDECRATGVSTADHGPALSARLTTPRGLVELNSD
ncbi:VOC family protein [Piscinibacter terrae]|uniref:VOC family protein n=1 Tax=Piscinibacter terrae TaxID=2496871 RepID=A0A3N7IZI0_9BURK|nr:VOC family protein [Albitalea terrae]RQP24122.1 VOC family protein [Albitalea terrae]